MDGTPSPAPPSTGRTPLHTRQITYQVYARKDGFWDVEARLVDTKHVRIERFKALTFEPGATVHDMHVVATVDDTLRIVRIIGDMHKAPFDECQGARDPLQGLVGAQLGRGWRDAIRQAIGGIAGCTHLRELLQNLATAGIQGIGAYRDQQRREAGLAPLNAPNEPPHFIGGCLSWRRDGPVVARVFPQFSSKERAADPPKEGSPKSR